MTATATRTMPALTMNELRDLPVGTKLRVIANGAGHGFEIGQEVVVVEGETSPYRGTSNYRRVKGETGGTYGYSVLNTDVSLLQPESAARAEARARLAETTLEQFKTLIRDTVIEESEARDFCDRADSWLAELGLEPRNIKKSYTVEVMVSAYVTVEIEEAADEEDARQQAYDELVGSVDFGRTKYLNVSPDYEVSEVELSE